MIRGGAALSHFVAEEKPQEVGGAGAVPESLNKLKLSLLWSAWHQMKR
jgi:hypothetical protein